MQRRRFLQALAAVSLAPRFARGASAMTLRDVPLELAGEWRGSAPTDAAAVLGRMRAACLEGVALLSDHQPERLRVDDHAGGNPYVWLHADAPETAWVIVNVGGRDWCNLAYQFGHELGHVLANSWAADAKPRNPCQWLEEALVEAFSLHGLARLADEWERAPPFPDDGAYGASIREYRERLLAPYRIAAREQGIDQGLAGWFAGHEPFLDTHGSVAAAGGAVTTMLGLLDAEPAARADLGCLNRWPGRSGVPLPDYLHFWRDSCLALRAPNVLPERLTALFAAP